MAKTKTEGSYRAIMTKTPIEIEAEQLDLKIEQAELNFQQGLLSLKGQLLTSEGKVKEAESVVKAKNLALEEAKRSDPSSLVQNIVNAKTAVNQSEVDLEAVKTEHKVLQDMYSYLETTQKQLFP